MSFGEMIDDFLESEQYKQARGAFRDAILEIAATICDQARDGDPDLDNEPILYVMGYEYACRDLAERIRALKEL